MQSVGLGVGGLVARPAGIAAAEHQTSKLASSSPTTEVGHQPAAEEGQVGILRQQRERETRIFSERHERRFRELQEERKELRQKLTWLETERSQRAKETALLEAKLRRDREELLADMYAKIRAEEAAIEVLRKGV